MQLGYNTNGLQSHRLDDALRLCADAGCTAVALTLDVHHLDPFRSTAGEVAAIAALLARLQLRPVIETGARFLLDPVHKHEPTLMTVDADARRRRFDFYGRAAAIGRDLGAEVVSFWSGVDRAPGPDSDRRLRDGVLAACDVIRAVSMVPSLEPEPGMALATLRHWRELAAQLGAAAPRLTLDIGHLYAEWEGDPVALVGASVPALAQVHLEDMQRGVHEHLVPGDGEVDFAGVLGALRTGGYGGPVCFELSRSSHMGPTALARCVAVWRAAGIGECG